jgi:hypothetical protein
MAGNNNKKSLFRLPGLDPEVDQYELLPVDIAAWLDKNAISGRGPGARGGNEGDGFFYPGEPGAGNPIDYGAGAQTPNYPYVPEVPGLTAKTPEVGGIVKQEVKQDPQGNATITVTFSLGPDQENMDYELRLTKTP